VTHLIARCMLIESPACFTLSAQQVAKLDRIG